jgi:hypothetical protein
MCEWDDTKELRRVRISVRRFEKYGIERGDTAIVVMNGDVRVGELGYFAVTCNRQFDPTHYKQFSFVCEQDSTCSDGYYNGPRTVESLCLRHDDVKKCNAHHNATAYGRVCAIERDGQPIETALCLRPFDERESVSEVISLRPAAKRKACIRITNGATNAGGIKEGDTVEYRPSAEFKDGDLVAFKDEAGDVHAAYLYHCNGKQYKYFSKTRHDTTKRKMHYDLAEIFGICEPRQENAQQGNRLPASFRSPKGQVKREIVSAGFDWSYFGVHKGDELTVEESGEAPIGKLVYIHNPIKDEHSFARVCDVYDDPEVGSSLRIALVTNDERAWIDVPLFCVVGPVVKVNHENCTPTRINDLREQIARLKDEYDAICNTSRIAEIEKEIYDLEHPPEESAPKDEDDFEWPDEIDG